MQSSSQQILPSDVMEYARASFISFYGAKGWPQLSCPDVDLNQLDTPLASFWQGWLDRTHLIYVQSKEGPSDINDWFETLEAGHRKVLVESKWMLADATYRFGLKRHLAPSAADANQAAQVLKMVAPTVQQSQLEALRIRQAHLEQLLSKTELALRNLGTESAATMADELQEAMGDTSAHQPTMYLPEKKDCEDGYPSDDQMAAWEWNRCLDYVAGMNEHLACEHTTNRTIEHPNWAPLRNPARVGSTVFQSGVSSLEVIHAAQRFHEYELARNAGESEKGHW